MSASETTAGVSPPLICFAAWYSENVRSSPQWPVKSSWHRQPPAEGGEHYVGRCAYRAMGNQVRHWRSRCPDCRHFNTRLPQLYRNANQSSSAAGKFDSSLRRCFQQTQSYCHCHQSIRESLKSTRLLAGAELCGPLYHTGTRPDRGFGAQLAACSLPGLRHNGPHQKELPLFPLL